MSCFSLPHANKSKCGCWFPAPMAFPAHQGGLLQRGSSATSASSKGGVALFQPNQTLYLPPGCWSYNLHPKPMLRFSFFDSCGPRSPGYSETSGTVTGINLCNYINQFSPTTLWEVSHCHPWQVNLWAPSAWCLSKPATLSLQAASRDLLMGQHLLNTDFCSLQLAKIILKACLGVWQSFWWLVA